MGKNNIIPLQEKSIAEECLIFKHSTRCPVSSDAAEVVSALEVELPIYWVNVVEQRPMSDWVEQSLSVTHQSPQLICVKNGAAVWNITHREIKQEKIEALLGK